ncbi:FAD-dependent monooxygenase [uncultured Cellulomonas sp.]|uniref:FAD-dependent monooxygenase n=1 Tax=uncultured Cellulomonas sp. TaxID=189682 RepID=UPI002613CE48|nr:FAD-dependent monooxygenase [uncultured Cellulomonas sp.]
MSSSGSGAGRRAVVVGAGIGGLAAALGLHQHGWDVQVLERAPALTPVGAGIALAPNGLRALDALGLGAVVRQRAAAQGAGGYRDPGGRWLLRQDLGAVTEALGDSFVVLRRPDLVSFLVDALPPGALRTGVEVRGVTVGDATRPAQVATGDGDLEVDLVVAADGVHSRLRHALFPSHPGTRYAGYVAWRLLPRVSADVARHGQFETWGRGRRFSALLMADDEVYCWATVSKPAGRDVEDDRAELLARFGDWHQPVPALIEATPPDRILRHDVVELARPLPALHAGRVALVGDAGHALTPDLGQGGCLALEDAVELALLMGRQAPVPEALAQYTRLRLPRVSQIAARSRQLARVGQASGPVVTGVRTAVLRAAAVLPAGVLARGLGGVVDWRPQAGA